MDGLNTVCADRGGVVVDVAGLDPGVVRAPAAAEHCVRDLAPLGASQESEAGVGGHPLGAVNGGRVAEFDGAAYVLGRDLPPLNRMAMRGRWGRPGVGGSRTLRYWGRQACRRGSDLSSEV